MRKYLLFILIFTISIGFAQQQETTIPQQNTTWEMLTYDVGNMFTSMGYSYTRPLHWKGNQWAQFGAVMGGTGLVYLFDEQTSDFLRNQKNGIPEIIREYGEQYGSPGRNYLFTGGVYLTGLFTKNQKLRRTGVLLVASASSAGLLQQVMKSVVGRARPVANLGKNTYDPFNRDRNFHTFPSGHGILAFSNAHAIAKQFKSPWIKAGIYTLGAIPGISRVWDGQHWVSDVVLSWAISVFTVESIDRYLDRKYSEKYNSSAKRLSWDLNFGPGTLGVALHF